MTTKYNGWTNYETWNVKLWLDNDEGSYRHWINEATETWDDAEDGSYLSRPEVARRALADRLQSQIDECNPLAGDASMFSDLLGAALSEVNWDEIANSLLEDNVDDYESWD